MNDFILTLIYKLEFGFKLLFMRSHIIIYTRPGFRFRGGERIDFGEFEAVIRRKK